MTALEILGHVKRCEIGGFTAIGRPGHPCVAYVASAHEAAALIQAVNAHAALVKALEPFAKVFDEMPSFLKAPERDGEHLYAALQLTVEHFRLASAALTSGSAKA